MVDSKKGQISVDPIKSLVKDAKMSLEKKEYDDGNVYCYVNGTKNFFPISKVYINIYEGTVEDLVDELKRQRDINKKQQDINKSLVERIKKIESKVDKYVG
jgi:predicted ribosome quality control (RQC) complex YloA/Tae2 family protein